MSPAPTPMSLVIYFIYFALQPRLQQLTGSPESYRDDNITRARSGAGDIWSLGAVASEAMVWTIKGEPGRVQYQRERCRITDELPNMAGGYHVGSFHDGFCRLPIIQKNTRTSSA